LSDGIILDMIINGAIG